MAGQAAGWVAGWTVDGWMMNERIDKFVKHVRSVHSAADASENGSPAPLLPRTV